MGSFFGGGEGVEGSGTKSHRAGPGAVSSDLSAVFGRLAPVLEHRAQILHFGAQGQPQILCATVGNTERRPRAVRARPRPRLRLRGGFRAQSRGRALPPGALPAAGTLRGLSAVPMGETGRERRGAAVRGLGPAPPRLQVPEAPGLFPGRAGGGSGAAVSVPGPGGSRAAAQGRRCGHCGPGLPVRAGAFQPFLGACAEPPRAGAQRDGNAGPGLLLPAARGPGG